MGRQAQGCGTTLGVSLTAWRREAFLYYSTIIPPPIVGGSRTQNKTKSLSRVCGGSDGEEAGGCCVAKSGG